MMKKGHSRLVCLLLALMLLTQNLALPVFANDDAAEDICSANENGIHNRIGYDTTSPTCTQPGYKGGSYCSLCGKVFTQQEVYAPATGHTSVDDPAVSATCTTPGKTAGSHCSVCNTVLTAQEEILATGHKKAVTTPAKAATCIENGCTEGWKCETCGYTEASKVLPATGHTNETMPAKAATCTEIGLTEGTKCSVCGEILTPQTALPATGHTKETIPAKAATCTESGLTEGAKCSVCGEILTPQKELPTTGHTKETIPAKAATCTESGLTEGTKCSVCGEILTPQQELPATGHTVQIDEAVPDTCTTPGKTQGSHCAVCGVTLEAQQEISPMGHAYEKRAGKAPTCGAPGRTDYYRCVDCGELLNAQTLPATGIHQFVPVSGDPNDGYSCQVCGKSYSGLTQDGSYPLLPYEKEDNANGFRLSNGEAPAKSAQLQVYRNEEGNYVNVLCLTWEDGTKSYVAFETGTANIGELLTIYLQNAKDAGTREKLEDASQPNFGVGFDESGNPFLYVVKDGTKYAFMVSTPVVETVEIVFGTKDLTTTEETQETQPIQKVEEQTEDQGITKIEDDSTDNTFVIQEYKENTGSNNFVRQPVTGFGREVQSSVCRPDEEVVVPRNGPPIFNLGIVDTGGSECDKKGHTGFKYVDDESHRCSRCHGEELHSYVDGVCAVCNGKCTHSRWYASVENCLCYYCKTPKKHNFVEKDLGCECSDCGVYFPQHWFANGINSCVRCKAKCSHPSWTTENGIVVCSICRIRETHAWQERNGSCWCANCGLVLSHVYKDGSCTRCKARCAHPGGMSNGTCKVCGYTCSHDFGWSRKNGDVCICKICRMEEAHHWRRFGGYYICSKCGAFSTKKKP